MGWTRTNWPTRTIEGTIDGVTITQAERAPLLNGDDPDVSFAFTFSGSIGTEQEARETARRGQQKARFGPTQHDALLPIARQWAETLVGTANPKLFITVGRQTPRGQSNPVPECRVEFDEQQMKVEWAEHAGGARFSIVEKVPLGTLVERILLFKRRIEIAKAAYEKIRAQGVGVVVSDEEEEA